MGCTFTTSVIDPDRTKMVKDSTKGFQPKKEGHPIVRNLKIMLTIADYFNLRDLARFSQGSRSFYWIAGRKQLLEKFHRRE